jgi:uncharacterized protein YecT (DUF1311 family)
MGIKHPLNVHSAIALRFCVGVMMGVLLLVSCDTKPKPKVESREVKPMNLVPMEWMPSLEQAQASVEETYEAGKSKSQAALIRETQNLADIADAQLFITYVLLMQRLDENDQSRLFNEQKTWLMQRAETAGAAIISKGGSLEALEYASAFRSITQKRLAELRSRLFPQANEGGGKGER